jgi:AcrR family transcriptional regulator
VLEAALAVLDRDGRDALTMRRLAEELDVSAPSLYVHVRSKEDLIDGVLDHVLDQVPLPPIRDDWRASLREGFEQYRRALIAHPGVIGLITERNRTSRSQMRLVEHSISLLEAAGLSTADAVGVHVTLVAFTLGFLAQEAGRAPGPSGDDVPPSELFTRAVAALLTRSVDERFRFGIDLILSSAASMAD